MEEETHPFQGYLNVVIMFAISFRNENISITLEITVFTYIVLFCFCIFLLQFWNVLQQILVTLNRVSRLIQSMPLPN